MDHRITDGILPFVTRFLSEFLKGQPSSGPFSDLAGLLPARVSMDSEDDDIELGDYSMLCASAWLLRPATALPRWTICSGAHAISC